MTTVDLSSPPPRTSGLLDALPRRVSLTLPELLVVADRAGGAPLPFDTEPLSDHAAHAAARAALHDPVASLTRRGLLHPAAAGAVDDGLLGAVGLLATPETAVDLDVTAAGIRARSWHRRTGGAVATLSTVDGLVFEVSWFPVTQWAAELGRAPTLPEDLHLRASEVPAWVEIPFELADAAAEAVRSHRSDLVPVLAAQHAGMLSGRHGVLTEAEAQRVLLALATECQGRLRVLAADVSGGGATAVGVVSWTLLADGWHALRPRRRGDAHLVVVSAVEPSDLAGELAPVLAEVVS